MERFFLKGIKGCFFCCLVVSFILAGCKVEIPDSSPLAVSSHAVHTSSVFSEATEASSASTQASSFSSSFASSESETENPASSGQSSAVSIVPSSSAASSSASRPAGSSHAAVSSGNSSSSSSFSAPVQTCTLQIDCRAALAYDALPEEIRAILPEDGFFYTGTVSIQEGDTVFDILLRTTRSQGIHLDFLDSPALRTKYIRGIGNLYEKQCGSTSGWTYYVDGVFAQTGCSQFDLHGGETILWVYVTG